MPYQTRNQSSPTANPLFIGNHYPHGNTNMKNTANNTRQNEHRRPVVVYLPTGTRPTPGAPFGHYTYAQSAARAANSLNIGSSSHHPRGGDVASKKKRLSLYHPTGSAAIQRSPLHRSGVRPLKPALKSTTSTARQAQAQAQARGRGQKKSVWFSPHCLTYYHYQPEPHPHEPESSDYDWIPPTREERHAIRRAFDAEEAVSRVYADPEEEELRVRQEIAKANARFNKLECPILSKRHREFHPDVVESKEVRLRRRG